MYKFRMLLSKKYLRKKNLFMTCLRCLLYFFLNKNQFIDCSFDSIFDTSFELKNANIESYNDSLKLFLNQFFKLFFSNGRLGRQWEHKVISPRFNGINKLKIDYNNLDNVTELKSIWFFNKVYVMYGMLRLLFKPYKKYLITGQINCLSNWFFRIFLHVFPITSCISRKFTGFSK